MAILQRIVHRIARDKWDEVMEWERKYEAIESRYGFPPSRYYRALLGPYDTDTLIVEREWESWAAWDEAGTVLADPERQKLEAEAASVFLTTRYEAYMVLE